MGCPITLEELLGLALEKLLVIIFAFALLTGPLEELLLVGNLDLDFLINFPSSKWRGGGWLG